MAKQASGMPVLIINWQWHEGLYLLLCFDAVRFATNGIRL